MSKRQRKSMVNMSELESKQVTVEVVDEPKKKSSGEGVSVGQALSSIVDSLEAALSGRGNSVMMRVNDGALAKLDMLVAATALAHKLIVATCDPAHFADIDGLKVEDWST